MFKTVLTFFRGSPGRGRIAGSDGAFGLDQQMRDAAAAVERSKRALAIAIAQDQHEGKRLETTLKRLRGRQIEAQAADEALMELDAATGPLSVAERLAEQGFGPRIKTTADDVLARLKAQSPASAA